MKEKENVAHRRQSKKFPVKEIYDNIAIYALCREGFLLLPCNN